MDILRQMEIFFHVATLSSFSNTAKYLGISKGYVSQQISELEKTLAVKLLNRSTRKLNLTEAGEYFLVHCQAIIQEKKQAIAVSKSFTEKPVGKLRISAPPSFSAVCLSEFIAQFLRKHPHIEVEMESSRKLLDLLDDKLDLAIRNTTAPPENYVAKHLIDYKEIVVASPSYLKKNGIPSSINDLRDHNCLVYGLDQYCRKWQFTVGGKIETIFVNGSYITDSFQSIVSAVINHVGIALLPEYIVSKSINAGLLTVLLNQYPSKTMCFQAIYLPSPFRAAKLNLFINELIEALEK